MWGVKIKAPFLCVDRFLHGGSFAVNQIASSSDINKGELVLWASTPHLPLTLRSVVEEMLLDTELIQKEISRSVTLWLGFNKSEVKA